MEDLFKQNLLMLRQAVKPQTFAQAIYGFTPWAQKSETKVAAPMVSREHFSEKAQVLESLERFAQEKIQESPEAVIKFPGGEIAEKPEPIWEGISQYAQYSDLAQALSLEAEALKLTLAHKQPGQLKVMFVAESFRKVDEFSPELKEGFINQLLPAFPFKTAEFFSRMLTAMKLDDREVLIYPTLFNDQDISDEVMKVAGFFRPEVIVTLGANSAHKILKVQERLTQLHGQFFNRKIENIGTFIVVPLFHPSIIENNQNMKKTAWADMQKIMKHLKKL
jgi:hypothetical protein